MNIKYTRLSTSDINNSDWLKYIRGRIPVTLLRQQIFLVSIVTTFLPSEVEYDFDQGSSSEIKYGVIVDCGSSGSRAHIFAWRSDSPLNQIEHVRDKSSGKVLSMHIEPGLSTLKNEPAKASDYVEPIMSFISKSIPQNMHSETPVYFLATAGLRLLDLDVQQRILSDINNDLKLKYDFPIKSQVISGSYEGIYSWLSVNINHELHSNSHYTKSYGMIEMGGASTQVTFELNPEVENAILKELTNSEAISAFRNEQITVDLGPNKSVKLFATTFLGLGVNSAREAAVDLLIIDYLNATDQSDMTNSVHDNFEVRLKDPCLTIGSSEIMMRPNVLLKNTRKIIGSSVTHQDETFKVKLEGLGDFLNCMNLLERTIQTVKDEKLNCPPSKPCPMSLLATNFIPYGHYHFVGLSEMYFSTNEMMNSAGPFNRTKVLRETKRICSTPLERLQELYAGKVSHEDRPLYECFKASWLLTTLHKSGFNMPDGYEKFTTVEQMNGHLIDWTIGAMITEIGLSKVDFSKN